MVFMTASENQGLGSSALSPSEVRERRGRAAAERARHRLVDEGPRVARTTGARRSASRPLQRASGLRCGARELPRGPWCGRRRWHAWRTVEPRAAMVLRTRSFVGWPGRAHTRGTRRGGRDARSSDDRRVARETDARLRDQGSYFFMSAFIFARESSSPARNPAGSSLSLRNARHADSAASCVSR